MPLDKCLMRLVKDKLPAPSHAQGYRMKTLVPNFDLGSPDMQSALVKCDETSPDVLVHVAKLSEVPGFEGFMCFARVYCGTLKVGSVLYDDKGDQVTVANLYLFRGYGVVPVSKVQAGVICAIGSEVADKVVKCATFSTRKQFAPLRPVTLLTASVMRTAIRPKQLSDLSALLSALKVLNRVDIQLDVIVMESGDYVLCTAGEVHTERVLTDLDMMTHIEVMVSPPSVYFRETILQKGSLTKPKSVTVTTPNGSLSLTGHAFLLPEKVRALLEEHGSSLKETPQLKQNIVDTLTATKSRVWQQLAPYIWVIGSPQGKFTNVLFCTSRDSSVVQYDEEEDRGDESSEASSLASLIRRRANIQDALCTGFNLAMANGPMCEEPMTGVGIVLTDITWSTPSGASPGGDVQVTDSVGTLSGQAMSLMKSLCRTATTQHLSRIVEPMYRVDVLGSGEVQGKICGIIAQRRGEVLEEVPYEGSNRFVIRGLLPATESVGLMDDLRIKTSGKATCILTYSGWRVVEPFDLEEEDDEDPVDPNAPTVTKALVEKVKARKGLASEISIPKAEKQKFSSRGT
eukprot:PhM_4_TR385/c2_g1_i4/m.104388/K14536/RIA1; ribosome assembly protein 1